MKYKHFKQALLFKVGSEFEMLKTPYFVARFQVYQYAKFGYKY